MAVMVIPGQEPRRTIDVVSNTIVAVAITAGATFLGSIDTLAPEGILAAYTIAAAVSGLPIVVKRQPNGD